MTPHHLQYEYILTYIWLKCLYLDYKPKLIVKLEQILQSPIVTMYLLNYEEDMKQSKLTASMQKLRDKFGIDIIKSTGEL